MGEWIKHRGDGCPVPAGTMVVVERFNGLVCGPFPAMFGVVDERGVRHPTLPYGAGSYNTWVHDDGGPVGCKVRRYRLHDDGSEAKTREARIEQFRKYANDALIGDKPVKAPKKESVS